MPIPKAPYLEFEKPVVDLATKIEELLATSSVTSTDVTELVNKKTNLQKRIQSRLTAWNRYELARRPGRPYALDYIEKIFTHFIEIHGDRRFGDDAAIVTGLAKLGQQSVALIGQQKGRDTKESIRRNFGMASPEGYRKALRLLKMAGKFNLPVITFIDTQGAFPGIGAEERGQAEAIAVNLREMAVLPVPIIVTIIGEGASGGALGIGVGDRVLMLENAWYGVISPQGCATILWGDASKKEEITPQMKLTARELLELKVIDRVIEEPEGGAHWDPDEMSNRLGTILKEELQALKLLSKEDLVEKRISKLGSIGVFSE